MTKAPEVKRLTFDEYGDAVRALRERGLRLSTSRRLVLRALFAAAGPVSAEHIARGLRIELTSVYRNLETLERHGLVRHVHLGHGPGLYLLVGQGEREYLYCERCGAVRALEPRELDPVRSQINELTGYNARFTHFAIVGICGHCAQRPSGNSRTRGGTMTGPGHEHEHPHSHEHEHADGTVHEHAHTGHEHEHVEHEHEHSHGDYVHSHPHVHEQGLEDQHEHGH
jgi:Fur family transcriptional regulator, ferric uptake regulator